MNMIDRGENALKLSRAKSSRFDLTWEGISLRSNQRAEAIPAVCAFMQALLKLEQWEYRYTSSANLFLSDWCRINFSEMK